MTSPIENVKTKPTYIWGAALQGEALFRRLDFLGLAGQVRGFLDHNPALIGRSFCGRPVLAPEAVLNRPRGEIFILLGAFALAGGEMIDQLAAAGLEGGRDYWPQAGDWPIHYWVEVSNTCNLRCLGCQHGNHPRRALKKMMSLAEYARVLDKITRDDPLHFLQYLYACNEPLLNPELPEMIRETQRRGLQADISTNLNFSRGLKEVIEARPFWLRLSASGWGPNYEIAHVGGRWDLFLANLHRVRDLREEYNPGMRVELFYHLYTYSLGDDRRRMRELCEELGFGFRETVCNLQPLDHLQALAEGRPLPEAARRFLDYQPFPATEALPLIEAERHLPCALENSVIIDSDLALLQCVWWFPGDRSLSDRNFLELSHEAIRELFRARSRDFCPACKARGFHRQFPVYDRWTAENLGRPAD